MNKSLTISLELIFLSFQQPTSLMPATGVQSIRWEYCPINPLSANPTKWLNTFKQFVDNSRRIV